MKLMHVVWFGIFLSIAAFSVIAAPAASNVQVTPLLPTAGDDLTCSFDYSSPENFSEQESAFEWWKGGVNQNVNARILGRGNTSVNDEWYCRVAPSDKLSNGTQVQSSNNVTILSTVQNVKMYVNDTLAWNTSGYYSTSTFVVELNDYFTSALSSCVPDVDGFCDVALTFVSDSEGLLNVTDLEILYTLPVVSLAIHNLSALVTNGSLNIFEFVINNNGTSRVDNVTWQLDLGDGTVINSTENTSMSVGENMFVYVAYEYAEEGAFSVVVNSSGVSATVTEEIISVSDNTSISTSSMDLNDFSEISSVSLGTKAFEFSISNNGAEDISVNWTVDFGDGSVINSVENTTLSADGKLFVYAQHVYNSSSVFNVTVTSEGDNNVESLALLTGSLPLDVTTLSVINISDTKRTFEFAATNSIDVNLTNVSWSFDTGDNFTINSTVNSTLAPEKVFFVFIDYDYEETDDFTVNASAKDNIVSDYEVLNVTIT